MAAETKTVTLTIEEIDRLVSHLEAMRDMNGQQVKQAQWIIDTYPCMQRGALDIHERRRDRHRAARDSASELIEKIGHERTDMDDPAWLRVATND